MTLTSPISVARSFLFVPGNRPERFEKAVRSGADAVIFDLEDAVPQAEKVTARETIANAWETLRAIGVPLVIRVNTVDQAFGQDDLSWLSKLAPPAGVMVPKAESATSLQSSGLRLPGVPLLPLIESAAGWAALPEIAATQGVIRLAFGHIDFMADTGLQCSEDESELMPMRFAIAMATRLNRLAPAIDGVTVAIQDDARLRQDTRRALRLGFGAKLCIHPRQVAVVHEELAPTDQETDWARRVIAADAASGGAAVQIDGAMVDLPVVLQARRILSRLPSAAS